MYMHATAMHSVLIKPGLNSPTQQVSINVVQSSVSLPNNAHLNSSEAQSTLDVLGHPEGHPLRHTQAVALLEAHVVVHMHHLSRGEVHQQVVKVTVTKADDVANHAHDGCGAAVGLSD